MADHVIENPILNSPYEEPQRHFRFTEQGITNEIVESRRKSTYFMPIPKAKKKNAQLAFETEWTEDRIEQNLHVDRIRDRVGLWRKGKYPGVTPTTKRLLQYWTNPERENKLFFCQIEALETAIYITEVASKFGDGWIDTTLREANDTSNPGLPRLAHKMATGSGKTVVMAMIIAWQALNKLANPQDARFSDAFMIVCPGITIRDRLRVLMPNDPEDYYKARDLVPPDLRLQLHRAHIAIVNYHKFQLLEKLKAPALTKKFVNPEAQKGGPNPFKESPDEMVRRVCRDLGNKKNIVVLNDEAHHCYRRKPDGVEDKLAGDEAKEAKQRDEEARIWLTGIEAIKSKIGVKAIFDLSATPFFLRGSGYSEGTLFPWVVSDFSLVDAIESGIVKVPRVPVGDDAMTHDTPTYRDLWLRIKDELPKGGRKEYSLEGEPKLPGPLEGALTSLYGNYEKAFRRWEQSDARERGQTPPVFIVVCNNTNVSKLIFEYVSGWTKQIGDETIVIPGAFSLFNNENNGRWLARPNTILVDSAQLESGEAMTADFKKIAAAEIAEFKKEYRNRYPGRDAEKLSDEDILREVMNTVGKAGKLGEGVRCVVSVSMLTEGWDANTVTHILGVRAFGTQLLCEQVVGRGLRRMNYQANDDGLFEPEYAEVYGVPFSFIPCSGTNTDPKPKQVTRVRALDERADREITFPLLIGYRFDFPADKLRAEFDDEASMILSTADIPTRVEVSSIVGEAEVHTLDDLKSRREQEIAFNLARLTLQRYFRDEDGCDPVQLFPSLLKIAKEWLQTCVQLKDGTFPQMLLLHEPGYLATDKIYRAIVRTESGEPRVMPRLRAYDYIGSTRYVDFNTTKNTFVTRADKCHISHVVADTGTWEQRFAQVLEDTPEVSAYVKNQSLGFTIPYTSGGEEHDYYPDFIAHVQTKAGFKNVIFEVSSPVPKKEKTIKLEAARTLWLPAVNNHGGLGEWELVEVRDPWDCRAELSKLIDG